MDREENFARYGNNCTGGSGGNFGGSGGCGCTGGSGGCRSKKVKQKKVPQRGLGVAQLEKIRLEEQQNKGAIHNFNPNVSPNSIPLKPPSPTEIPSPNALFRPTPSIIDLEKLRQSSVQFLKSSNAVRGEISSDQGFSFRPQMNLPYEFNGLVSPRQNASQQRLTVVNVSSGISPHYDVSSHVEPPSNQSFHDSKLKSLWHKGDKMIGVKRSYPFSLETPRAPSFLGKFDPSYSKTDDAAGFNYISKGPSNASPVHDQNSSDLIRDNGRINGDFLTLATPRPASPPLCQNGRELCDFGYLSSQEIAKNNYPGPGPSMGQSSTSFSPTKFQDDQTAPYVCYGDASKEEAIDLDLKL